MEEIFRHTMETNAGDAPPQSWCPPTSPVRLALTRVAAHLGFGRSLGKAPMRGQPPMASSGPLGRHAASLPNTAFARLGIGTAVGSG